MFYHLVCNYIVGNKKSQTSGANANIFSTLQGNITTYLKVENKTVRTISLLTKQLEIFILPLK